MNATSESTEPWFKNVNELFDYTQLTTIVYCVHIGLLYTLPTPRDFLQARLMDKK